MNSQAKSFKVFQNCEQNPQINSVFHDLLSITSKFLDNRLSKLESHDQKTINEIDELKDSIRNLNHDLQNLQTDEDIDIQLKSKKDVISLNNEIKLYFKKRERSLEKERIFNEIPSSPETNHPLLSPHTHMKDNINGSGKGSEPTLKNSSSYKEFKHMMEINENEQKKKSSHHHNLNKEKSKEKLTNHVNKESQNNTEKHKESNINERTKEKTKKKMINEKSKEKFDEKNEITPRNLQIKDKEKGNKKLYQYYFTNSNERKLNDLITDSQTRNNKEVLAKETNGTILTGNNKKSRRNTNNRKKNNFQKELAKNYTVLASKSKEKLIVNENGEVLDYDKTQKLEEIPNSLKTSKKKEEKSEDLNGGERTIKTAPNKKQESVSCDRFYEENKIKSPSSKFLNYYYFFDKNKEIQTIGEI